MLPGYALPARFPRTRGDRPQVARPRSRRGSPARAGIDPQTSITPPGSPARAGIDRLLSRVAVNGGMRMGSPARAGIDPGFSGWSRPTPSIAGSPARAGIDPGMVTWNRTARFLVTSWFPRTRGDRPAHASAPSVTAGFPRTRGDRPLYRRLPIAARGGSPARAGIDRYAWHAVRSIQSGSPARAGIDRILARPWTRSGDPAGSPARAGIDPSFAAHVPQAMRVPPHARG